MISKPFTVGGEGTGSDPDVYALMLKNVFGVKLRLISGYPGTTEMALAVERGEVDGRASWSWTSLKSLKPDWIAQKKSRHSGAAQHALAARTCKDVPLIGDIRQDRAAAADREARHQPAGHGPAVHGAARPARRSRRGAADGVRRDDEGPGVRRRGEGARPGGQPGERGGARQADRRALRDAEGCGGGDAEGQARHPGQEREPSTTSCRRSAAYSCRPRSVRLRLALPARPLSRAHRLRRCS